MEKHSFLYIFIAFILATLIMGLVIYIVIKVNIITDYMSGSYSYNYNNQELIYVEPSDSGEVQAIEIIEEEPYLGPQIFSGDSRSIAFMIDNDVNAAWPHAGLNNAYMIYEMLVEGGSSRLIAFFKYDNIPDIIGPVRSCRHYFLDYVQEHDAIYCHYGQSTQGGEALKARKISNLNGIYDDYCKRITDVDKTWHNAFAVKEKVEKYVARKGYTTTQKQGCILTFNEKDVDLVSGDEASNITCKFPNTRTSFEYDEESKTYLISMRGVKHVDKYTKEQCFAKNILIYQVDNASLWSTGDHREVDNQKRQELYNTGSGTGYYITNGKAIKMQWSKLTHSGKTTYKDMLGNEIKFNDGITWVEILPKSRRKYHN